MKKIINFVLALVMMFSMCSCTSSTKNYDNDIIEISTTLLEEWEPEEGRSFSVTVDSQNIYHIDINGDELQVQLVKEPIKRHEKCNFEEYNSKLVETSREKVVDYINSSTILKNKELLIEYINNVPFKTADYIDSSNTGAEYDLDEDTIFINRYSQDYLCEWMIVHELIHALCQKTNGGLENLLYPYTLFNEVLTDIITASINPDLSDEIMSAYSEYYDWIYLYLGCVGISGIEAYFYGYDEILAKIPQNELDIFVESLEQINCVENAIVIVCNCINEWGLEK